MAGARTGKGRIWHRGATRHQERCGRSVPSVHTQGRERAGGRRNPPDLKGTQPQGPQCPQWSLPRAGRSDATRPRDLRPRRRRPGGRTTGARSTPDRTAVQTGR